MNIKTMPKDTLAELLLYLSEHEDLSSVEKLNGVITSEEVRAALRELAGELARESASERRTTYDAKGCKKLSKEAKNVISCLSPREERSLLSAFGLIDSSTKLMADKK